MSPHLQVTIPDGLIDALRHQRQIDMNGTEVGVSRQACDEAAQILSAVSAALVPTNGTMTDTAEMQEAKPVAWLTKGRDGMDVWWDDSPTDAEPLYSQSDFDAMRAQRDEAIRLLKQVSLALESLTPSGSEYISRSKLLNTYYADAEACCRFVKGQKEDGRKARIEAVGKSRLVARLVEALRPFAEAYKAHDDPGLSDLDNEQPVAWHVPLGAFRRARAALSTEHQKRE